MHILRYYIALIEATQISDSTVPILYHGTCADNARALIQHGWQPRSGASGGNRGQARYLYLSTGYEDALWFAQQKDCDAVLELRAVPMSYLIVDPEDGTADTVAGELNLSHGLPGKLALIKPLSADHFHASTYK